MKSTDGWSKAEKRLLYGFLVVNVVWFLYLAFNYYSETPGHVVRRLEKCLYEEFEGLRKSSIVIARSSPDQFDSLSRQLAEQGVVDGYRLYFNDSLVNWSDNRVSFPRKWVPSAFTSPVWFLGPYTLLVDTLEKGSSRLFLYKIVHQQFSVDNNLVNGGFCFDFRGREGIFLSSESSSLPVTLNKSKVFSIEFISGYQQFWGVNQWLVLAWMVFMSLACSVLLLALLRPILPRASIPRSLAQVVIIVFLWWLFTLFFSLISGNLPGDLFKPFVFASGLVNPNAAAITVNIVFLMVLAIVFQQMKFEGKVEGFSKSVIGQLILVVLVAVGYRFLLFGFSTLVNHTSVPLDTHRLSSFSVNSLLIYMLLFILFLSWFIPSIKLLAVVKRQKRMARYQFLFVFILLTVLGGLFTSSPPVLILWETVLAATLFLVVVFMTSQRYPSFVSSMPETLVSIGALAALLSVYVSTAGSAKELAERQALAENYLVNSRDQLAESRLLQIQSEVGSDSLFLAMVPTFASGVTGQPALTEYLLEHYFGRHFGKYAIQFTYCLTDDLLYVAEKGKRVSCEEFFLAKTESAHCTVDSSRLWFLGFSTDRSGYLSHFVVQSGNFSLHVYIELLPLRVSRGIGISEVTATQALLAGRKLSIYSYARYLGDKLTSHAGEFSYWRNLPVAADRSCQVAVFDDSGWSHLMLKSPDNSFLVISHPSRSWFVIITLFSYIFLGFSFVLLLILGATSVLMGRNLPLRSFRTRFQGTVFLLIVFTLIAIGVSSVYFIIRLNEEKNISLLSDKAHSILIELQHKLSNYDALQSSDSLYLGNLTRKFSDVFFTDINLYDSSGFLLATSQPVAFSGEILAPYMDGEAREAMLEQRLSKFVHNERFGEWTFLSAYLPFINQDGVLLAYLNLPAFSRQEELRSEIGSFLITFINVYAVILLIAALAGLLIARLLTRPLQLVASHLSSVKLGSANAKIRWQGSDELALLIVEYNRMLDELDSGAIELKIREREATWREMARQVAHEIRNPLTPLSLNVQYLKKSWNENPEAFGQRLDRFVSMMQEQIERLNAIAADFGKYGSLPQPSLNQVNIVDLLDKVISVFTFSKTAITLTLTEAPVEIQSDAGLLQVVFNNLIKNAIQSVPDTRESKIHIQISVIDAVAIQISISDNGQGIPGNERDKIFTPYFTTKTQGSGIGLHLAFQIVNSLGGKIWFDSVEGEGTVFFVRLPVDGVLRPPNN